MENVQNVAASGAQVSALDHSARLPRVGSMSMRILPGLGLLLLGALGGWMASNLSGKRPDGQRPTDVLAMVGGTEVTRADVEQMAPEGFMGLERQRQDLTEHSLEQAIRVKLVVVEAAARGVAPDLLAREEVYTKNTEPTDEEMEAVYRRSGTSAPREQALGQIRAMLKRQKQNQRYEEFLVELRKKHEVKELLQPLRLNVATGIGPSKGAENAPVTIVEFSDFQCPFCQQLLGPLGQVLEAYGDVVRLEYRQFPLASIHPNAPKAAEASLCANDQGRFWELHDAMFANQGNLFPDQLKARARTLNIDGARFDECLDSNKYAKQVAVDLEEGKKLGIIGTPGLFVNGRFMGGDRTAEDIAKMVLDELRRAGRPLEPRRMNPIRTMVSADGFPTRGPAGAPVTIVEFADFQCPYCKQMVKPLEQLLKTYGDSVRLVYRQFPIASIHPEAQKAAEASLCASAQGKFWEMHDALYADQQGLDVPSLRKTARSLGLNGAKFDSCLDSEQFASEIKIDLEAGRSAGITGTPGFFINGRFLSGIQRFESMAAIIEDELAARKPR